MATKPPPLCLSGNKLPAHIWLLGTILYQSLRKKKYVYIGINVINSATGKGLTCNTNNKAETVFEEFYKATQEYGVPKKVRSDKGGENVQVCYFMVSYYGPNIVSHIAGFSTHNQRIERLWRDVFRCVVCTYHELFYELEAIHVLDADSELDLFILHCLFLPRIKKSLSDFSRAWNLHSLRTEHNWCPRKIWVNSIARDAVDTAFNPQNPCLYGVDPSGPLPEDEVSTVNVPEIVSPLAEEQLEGFLDSIDSTTIIHNLEMAAFCFSNAKRMLLECL